MGTWCTVQVRWIANLAASPKGKSKLEDHITMNFISFQQNCSMIEKKMLSSIDQICSCPICIHVDNCLLRGVNLKFVLSQEHVSVKTM